MWTYLEYISQTEGQWPKSWNDLRAIDPETDFESVAKRVDFDFTADPQQIANQTPSTFRAIAPHKPCYYRIDAEVQRLIDALRRYYNRN